MLIKRNVSILSKGEGDDWNIGVQSGLKRKYWEINSYGSHATCTISSVAQHMFYWLALAWAGHPENNNALLLIIASSLAMGLTMLGLVLVARDTNILSCFVWSRGKVTNSRSWDIRFKSGLARLASLEETLSWKWYLAGQRYVGKKQCLHLEQGGGRWLEHRGPRWV